MEKISLVIADMKQKLTKGKPVPKSPSVITAGEFLDAKKLQTTMMTTHSKLKSCRKRSWVRKHVGRAFLAHLAGYRLKTRMKYEKTTILPFEKVFSIGILMAQIRLVVWKKWV